MKRFSTLLIIFLLGVTACFSQTADEIAEDENAVEDATGTELSSDVADGISAISTYLNFNCPAGYRCLPVLECLPCDYGSYKSDTSSKRCTRCPTGCTTLRKGASSWRECVPMCPPGYETSECGKTCVKCYPGFYKSTWRNDKCTQCPAASSPDTVTLGMTSEDQCFESDDSIDSTPFPEPTDRPKTTQSTVMPSSGGCPATCLWEDYTAQTHIPSVGSGCQQFCHCENDLQNGTFTYTAKECAAGTLWIVGTYTCVHSYIYHRHCKAEGLVGYPTLGSGDQESECKDICERADTSQGTVYEVLTNTGCQSFCACGDYVDGGIYWQEIRCEEGFSAVRVGYEFICKNVTDPSVVCEDDLLSSSWSSWSSSSWPSSTWSSSSWPSSTWSSSSWPSSTWSSSSWPSSTWSSSWSSGSSSAGGSSYDGWPSSTWSSSWPSGSGSSSVDDLAKCSDAIAVALEVLTGSAADCLGIIEGIAHETVSGEFCPTAWDGLMCVAETIVPYNRQGCFDEMVKLVTDDVSGIIKQVIDAIPGVDQGTVNDIMSFLNYASLCDWSTSGHISDSYSSYTGWSSSSWSSTWPSATWSPAWSSSWSSSSGSSTNYYEICGDVVAVAGTLAHAIDSGVINECLVYLESPSSESSCLAHWNSLMCFVELISSHDKQECVDKMRELLEENTTAIWEYVENLLPETDLPIVSNTLDILIYTFSCDFSCPGTCSVQDYEAQRHIPQAGSQSCDKFCQCDNALTSGEYQWVDKDCGPDTYFHDGVCVNPAQYGQCLGVGLVWYPEYPVIPDQDQDGDCHSICYGAVMEVSNNQTVQYVTVLGCKALCVCGWYGSGEDQIYWQQLWCEPPQYYVYEDGTYSCKDVDDTFYCDA